MVTGVLLDIAGVLHQNGNEIPGAVGSLARLRARDLPVRFLTNTTRRPKRAVLHRLRSMGFAAEASDILTPAEAACAWLTNHGYAPHLLVHPDLEEDFAHVPDSDTVAVVVGDAGPYFTYDRMNAVFRRLEAGAPFLALAANRVFRDADGQLSLDAGAFVRALEYASGRIPILLGKPSPDFFMAGAQSMKCAPNDVVIVGDDAENDVAGGLHAGIGDGLLVRTGKYRPGDETRFHLEPSHVVADIGEAVDSILNIDRSSGTRSEA